MAEVINGTAALPESVSASSTPIANGSAATASSIIDGKPRKLTKNQLKRERKKHKKEIARKQNPSNVADSDTESVASTATITSSSSFALAPGQKQQQVQLSLVPEVTPNFDLSDLNLDQDDAVFADYKRIMQKFSAGVCVAVPFCPY
ncbi:hypothetical protein TWF173_003989 [Orbilia oligospora]|nr:hypothetical protein TWF173_003989 [Orbilia oligospora]